MKWIGQHIYDLVARFRNDVYLEDISSGTIASGGNLGLDSNNKIVKQDDAGITDLHGAGVDGSANQLLTDDGDGTVTSEANLTYDGTDLTAISSSSGKPVLTLKTTHTTATSSAELQFLKDAADTEDGEDLGIITFYGEDEGNNNTKFAHIKGEIAESDDGAEGGSIKLAVATHDGEMRNGLIIQDGDAEDEIDVTIGDTATSLTTITGTLTIGSTAFVNNSGVIQVATQGTIDHDSLANFVAAEHYRWDNDISSTATIHANNIPTLNQNTTGTAATVTTAAQTNITSLGTLTALTVDDVAIDTKTITITGDTSDTCTITAGAAGATTITTTDAAGAAGHFEVAADGDIILDAAGTIKLEGPVRPTGQLQYTYHNFTDDIDTTKIYLSLADADSEGTATTGIKLPFTAPLAGKLLRIYLRANQNLSTKTLTWRLETQALEVTFGDGPTIVGTQSGAGCSSSEMTTYDFTSSLDSGDNIIDAGDVVYLSIQSDATTSNTKFYVTCLWEWDMSSIG